MQTLERMGRAVQGIAITILVVVFAFLPLAARRDEISYASESPEIFLWPIAVPIAVRLMPYSWLAACVYVAGAVIAPICAVAISFAGFKAKGYVGLSLTTGSFGVLSLVWFSLAFLHPLNRHSKITPA